MRGAEEDARQPYGLTRADDAAGGAGDGIAQSWMSPGGREDRGEGPTAR